jgi:predicted  nucleic acid-binding Zn-ribbon protein
MDYHKLTVAERISAGHDLRKHLQVLFLHRGWQQRLVRDKDRIRATAEDRLRRAQERYDKMLEQLEHAPQQLEILDRKIAELEQKQSQLAAAKKLQRLAQLQREINAAGH